jgi:hypothetical protein
LVKSRHDKTLVVLQLEEHTAGNFTFKTAMGAAADSSGRSQLVLFPKPTQKARPKSGCSSCHFGFPSVCVALFQVCVVDIKCYICLPLRCGRYRLGWGASIHIQSLDEK